MNTWVGRHWRALAGAIALLLPLWQGLRSLLSVLGDIDFVVSKADDPGWIGAALSSVNAMPAYINLMLIGVGLALIWADVRGTATTPSAAHLARIVDRATADTFLKQFADQHSVRGPMQGGGGRIFDRYVSCYNAQGGSLALAVRQDNLESAPYLNVDQNDQERATRYGGRDYAITDINSATNDFLRRKATGGYSLGQRPAT